MISAELKGSSIVIIGHFNPAMFHPFWFEKNGVINKEEAELAISRKDDFQMILSNPLTVFRTEELFVKVEENRMQIDAVNNVLTLLKDFVVKTFRALYSNEVKSFGYNYAAHYRLDSLEMYQEIGDKLAPKQYWGMLLGNDMEGIDRKGGLVQLKMSEMKPDNQGSVLVEVAPSIRIRPCGIYIACNDHYNLKKEEQDGQSLATFISKTFDERINYLENLQKELIERLTQ